MVHLARKADGTTFGEITVAITIPTNGNENFNQNVFSIYPNPTSDVVIIVSALPVVSVKIYDTLGREVYSATSSKIDISILNAGAYVLM